MADGELARMLQVITQKLENLKKNSEERETGKVQQKTRYDALADILLQTNRKLNFLENEEDDVIPLGQFDEDGGFKN